MKFLTKANFCIAKAIDPKAESPTHSSIFVSPDETRATDGHCAFIVTTVEPAQMPLFEQYEGVEPVEFFTAFTLDHESARQIYKSIPKPKKDDANSKSRFAVVDGTSEDNERATISVNDLLRQSVVKAHKLQFDYPDIEKAFPRSKPKFTAKFNPDLLSKALKIVAEFSALTNCGSIELQFFGAGNALVITAGSEHSEQQLTGAVMPQRPGDQSEGESE